MNPQYAPPQQFGVPGQLNASPQSQFAPQRSSPSAPQGSAFQSVPLATPPIKQPQNGPAPANFNNPPPVTGQFPLPQNNQLPGAPPQLNTNTNLGPPIGGPSTGGLPPQGSQFPPPISSAQLPPTQPGAPVAGGAPSSGPFSPNPSTRPPIPSGQLPPGPQQFGGGAPMAKPSGAMPPGVQNGPPQFMNGPGFGPPPPHHPGQQPPPPAQQPPPLNRPPPPNASFPQPGQPPMPTQKPYPGPPKPGQPMAPNSNQYPPMPNSQGPQMPPMANQQPPMPGQGPPNQFGGRMPPMPGQYPGPGPLPNQYQGPNQLAGQMQNMNLGPPGRHPGAMNGETDHYGSPLPPPPPQGGGNQQYLNGQQGRPPFGPGYPPMPGQQQPPMGPGAGPYQHPYQQPQQQAKRLDPDHMPSPIQVTQDDQQNRSGIFCTNQKGLVPPLVTTNFIVQDQGNASPRLIRSTMYSVPISQDIMKQAAIPFSLVISPMARTMDQEYPPSIVDFGELGPVRCIRCKAYMCPFMQFIDAGRRFQCLFCKATTDVPAEYFQHLDHTGQRLDRYERPELVLGTYEFVATTDYCRNNTLPKPPAVIFIIDVSYNNIKSGLVHLLCAQMKEIIQNLPVDQGKDKSNMRVGFITYNSTVHFYNIKGNLAAPQMLVVGDINEMFMPLLDGFLCTPEESGPLIDALMQQIPAMFGDTRETETILLPAILAGLEALKASDCTGKLMVFHSTLPTSEAPGKLKNRDDRKLLGTDKERTVLTPQNQAYNQLGQDCVGAGCSVDLFIFNNAYIDIATISQVSRLSGGEVFKYTYFQADIDGERLIKDIITDISRPIAFDAVMRVRTSTGVRPTDFYGHFFMSNTTDMELAAIDCDKAVAIEIKHDDKLSEDEGVYVQAALLYTSCSGQRRLRVINLSLKTCSQMADLYRSCDCDTIINYISKSATYKLLDNSPKAVKDGIVTRAAQILASYRKNCASPSSAGQLILPECMKLLPLYVNCLLKSDAISGGSDMTIDDRSYVMQAVMIMDIPTSVNYFYPRLIPIHDVDPSKEPLEIPAAIRCTADKISEQGVYILENGVHLFLWIGLGASPDFIQSVFGAPSAIQVEIERPTLPELDNALSVAVRTIIDEIRVQRHRWMRLTIVRQREKLEPVFKHFLAEDRGTDGSPSYVDFLIHMHKEIRTILS